MSALQGQLGAISAAGSTLGIAFSTMYTAADAIEKIDAPSWQGWAADAFRASRSRTGAEGRAHAVDVGTVGDILKDHAARVGAVVEDANRARQRLREAWDRLAAFPPDVGALDDVIDQHQALSAARRRADSEAEITAAKLYAVIVWDTTSLPGLTWPPEGWPEAGSLTGVRLGPRLRSGSAFDPLVVSQGNIGDCYLIATLMALMQDDDGDQLLRDGLRWDPDRDGWWVTLYEDGRPIQYFVDRGHTYGATEDGGPGVVSIYEAALGQHLEYADLTDGGWPEDMVALLTGKDAPVFNHDAGGGGSWDTDELRSELDGGAQLAASTVEIPAGQHITVQRPGSDQPVDVEILGPHVYTVVSVEPNGDVWMLNPHGPNNNADGGGPILVSAADFDRWFHRVSSTGVLE